MEEEIKQVIDFLSRLGNGDISRGLDILQDNHRWLSKQRQRGDALSAVIFYGIITACVAGLMAALWAGIRVLLTATTK